MVARRLSHTQEVSLKVMVQRRTIKITSPMEKGSWEAGKGKGKGKGKGWGNNWNSWDEATGWTWKEVGTSIAGTALMGWLFASDEQA